MVAEPVVADAALGQGERAKRAVGIRGEVSVARGDAGARRLGAAARIEARVGRVPRGGVSFHHGNTFHQSGTNRSTKWRRACALHYVNDRTFFENPALPYDDAVKLRIS